MPFIKVNSQGRDRYINSENVDILEFQDSTSGVFAVLTFSNKRELLTSIESGNYFLSEVGARDTQISVNDIPKRPLTSRLATALRDDCPDGLTLIQLQRDIFPTHSHAELTAAASALFNENVIDVNAESGLLIHRSHIKPSPDPSTEAAEHNYDGSDDSER